MEAVLPAKELGPIKERKKTYFRKREDPLKILGRIKLYPSRSGALHGILSVVQKGGFIELTTHCGQRIRVRKSRRSRVARWLRNKWYVQSCSLCKVPRWKLDKFSLTVFN
jgi:pyrrolysyl-tRNA synthetase-like protein